MTLLATALLIFLVFETALSVTADVLNLKSANRRPPAMLTDLYTQNTFRKTYLYLRSNTRFGWISSAFDLMIFLVFWFSGGFPALENVISGLQTGPVVAGLLFFAVLGVAKSFLSLPFSLYHTFVIEEKFGFNRTTLKTFIFDGLKGLALSVVIGLPAASAVLWFFHFAGPGAWLMVFAALTAFSLLVQYIAPTWIMPLFNRFDPLPEGELRTAIFELAGKAGFPLKQLFVMDGSKRSAHSNAFFTGFGKNKRIVLYDTLLKEHTTAELVAILAHEIGHYKKRHILKGTLISTLHTFALCYLLSVFLTWQPLYDAFYLPAPSVHIGFILFGILLSPIELLLTPAMNALSRRHEFEADLYARTLTGSAGPLVEALKKLSASNLSNLNPHKLYVWLHYSHPPLKSRISALLNT